MKPVVSILLGAGFSVPAGLPTVWEINKRMGIIPNGDICITSDLRAFFLNGKRDDNALLSRSKRLFVETFLNFYNGNTPQGTGFHYEDFFDYYSFYLENGKNAEEIETFCRDFDLRLSGKVKSPGLTRDHIVQFDITFNLLLKQLLFNPSHLEKRPATTYPKYSQFVQLLERLLATHDLKLHTLNHDLFIDSLCSTSELIRPHYSDGFAKDQSPIYREYPYSNDKTNLEALPHFKDSFSTPCSVFKLHGSIDNKLIHASRRGENDYHVKDAYDGNRYFLKSANKPGEVPVFEQVIDKVQPSFLSGTQFKRSAYSGDNYYKILFRHFEKNLLKSEILIVIGYSFGDQGINERLQGNLRKNAKVLVVDPSTLPELESLGINAQHFQLGVQDIRADEILKATSNL